MKTTIIETSNGIQEMALAILFITLIIWLSIQFWKNDNE